MVHPNESSCCWRLKRCWAAADLRSCSTKGPSRSPSLSHQPHESPGEGRCDSEGERDSRELRSKEHGKFLSRTSYEKRAISSKRPGFFTNKVLPSPLAVAVTSVLRLALRAEVRAEATGAATPLSSSNGGWRLVGWALSGPTRAGFPEIQPCCFRRSRAKETHQPDEPFFLDQAEWAGAPER